MLRRFQSIAPACTFAILSMAVFCATSLAQEKGEKYHLQYKLSVGEQLVSKVIHRAETRTRMQNVDEVSSSTTTSEKVWEVTDVNAKGEMTFEYRINSVKLTQSVGESESIEYDSSAGSEVPEMFEPVAETVGKTLATITINSHGQVISRDKELKTPQLGMGELTLPLPKDPIAIGERWSVPREIRVKLESGKQKRIKVREVYTLDKVATGVATLLIRTEVLTPVKEQAVRAQLIQQLSQGKIKFDIDRGRLISKNLDWQEEVVGFRGADTSLNYDGRFTEELQAKRTAARSSTKK